MEEKKQIENERLTKVYHTNHIVEAITVEKRCTGISDHWKCRVRYKGKYT